MAPSVGPATFLPELPPACQASLGSGVQIQIRMPLGEMPALLLGCAGGMGPCPSLKSLFSSVFLGVQFFSHMRCSFRAVVGIQGEPLREAK